MTGPDEGATQHGRPTAKPLRPLLGDVRVLEVSMLGGAAVTTSLADLGADVIKVEAPGGDYIREMTWPIVEGVSLMHLHINRGKRSVVLDLNHPTGVALFEELVAEADAVVEAMRPGQLAKLGLGYQRLRSINPRIVLLGFSGYGSTGPYRSLPAHGIAFDAWAGIVTPDVDDEGFCSLPDHVSVGINAGPLHGALSLLAGITAARSTGEGCELELAQADAAVAFDWYRTESRRAYERPAGEVTGNRADGYERRAPGTAGMRDAVRYQVYETSDGHILFMASERSFWHNFCRGVDRVELFDRWPGEVVADHARGNLELRAELRDLFRARTTMAWMAFADMHDVPIVPVNTPETLATDPQFAARFSWMSKERMGADQLVGPVKLLGGELPIPARAPTPGQHTDEVLATVLNRTASEIDAVRDSGACG